MYKAHLVTAVKVNGETMREFKSEGSSDIFLPFGADYSLYLKNMDTRRAIVSIEIDGEDVLDGSQVIVNGNSSLDIEGFLNGSSVENKFRFIEKSDKIREHKGEGPEDGLIRIEFQYEKPYERPFGGFLRRVDTQNTKGLPNPGDITYSGISGSSAKFSTQSINSMSPMNDEGITVAGAQTNQQFTQATVRALDSEKHVMVFRLRGETADNMTVIRPILSRKKVECSSCGTKGRSGAKFCSECSTALV